ncbi:MAG: hypothetical protein V4673_17225 [Pseudomonadota bacterium]
MKKYIVIGTLLAAAPFFVVPAQATGTATVNGVTYTCTNSCNVSTSGGVTTVTDCCGGRVSGTFQVPRAIEEN